MGLTCDGILRGEKEMPKTSILILIVGVIFMKGNSATGEEVWEVLSVMGLYPWRKPYVFGEHRKLITNHFMEEECPKYNTRRRPTVILHNLNSCGFQETCWNHQDASPRVSGRGTWHWPKRFPISVWGSIARWREPRPEFQPGPSRLPWPQPVLRPSPAAPPVPRKSSIMFPHALFEEAVCGHRIWVWDGADRNTEYMPVFLFYMCNLEVCSFICWHVLFTYFLA